MCPRKYYEMRGQNISKNITLQNKHDAEIEMNFGLRTFETCTSISQAVIPKSLSRNMKSIKVRMPVYTETLKFKYNGMSTFEDYQL
jgi:hypothetical protein